MRVLFFLFTSILLVGCSSGISVSLPEKFEDTPEFSTGYLTGSLSTTTDGPSSGEGIVTTLYIRQTGDDDIITLIYDNSDYDFNTGFLKGQIFAVPLPAGDYELFCIGFKGDNGNKTIHSKSNDNLGLTFTIRSGNVTYIGQFVTSSLIAKSKLWNQEYPSGYGVVTYNDANERDKALFFDQYPELLGINFNHQKLAERNSQVLSAKTN
ncbi:hypothetical protein [uncultured Photobacterium sp.]|uniref:hypothetical protein n=1 Tax=uncultured Photobacterium sp. TaxID=173973 RepID=UPI002621D134|nr:hypothetical protein [uncultured Photobacterium sp.]